VSSVDIRDLDLSFGEIEVLKQLNLDVAEGEFLVLLGPSGCGKSTLLNCIAGLLDVTDGQIYINNKNVTWEEPKDRGIGMVFQSYALYPQMTVEKNLSFGLRVAGMPRAEIKQRVSRAAEILQIEPLLKRKPAALSGGQRQRVAIGRALVRDVDVFLFDEPLSNLDAKLRTDLRVEIKRLHNRLKNTIVYVTHDQIEAMTLADRIAIMKGGVIQQLGTPKEIYHQPHNRFVAGFIGSPGMNFLPGELQKTANSWQFHCQPVNDSQQSAINIPLSAYSFAAEPRDGQKVEFGIRPEHVVLGDAAVNSSVNTTVVIDIVEPMGADTVAWSTFLGHSLNARLDSESEVSPEQSIAAGFDPAKASLFDVESGQRI